MAPQPIRDIAILILESGLRIGEVLALKWADVNLDPAEGYRFGLLRVRDGKSKNAKRVISLTDRTQGMLRLRPRNAEWVFTNGAGTRPLSVFTIEAQHAKMRGLLKLSEEFVLHGLRHTFLTRLGAANADVFTLMKIAGHSTVSVSQRYVHPTAETMEAAMERLQALNQRASLGAATKPRSLSLHPPLQ